MARKTVIMLGDQAQRSEDQQDPFSTTNKRGSQNNPMHSNVDKSTAAQRERMQRNLQLGEETRDSADRFDKGISKLIIK